MFKLSTYKTSAFKISTFKLSACYADFESGTIIEKKCSGKMRFLRKTNCYKTLFLPKIGF